MSADQGPRRRARAAKKSRSRPPKRWRAVALRFGWAESALVAPMLLVDRSGWHATPADALMSVAQWFFMKWMDDVGETARRACCAATRGAIPDAAFCAECGDMIAAEFAVEDYQAWIRGVAIKTADGFGCWDELGTWTPWTPFDAMLSSRDGVVAVREKAEEVLSWALWFDDLPPAAAEAIRGLRAEVVESHPDNRIRGRKLDIDGLIALEASDARKPSRR